MNPKKPPPAPMGLIDEVGLAKVVAVLYGDKLGDDLNVEGNTMPPSALKSTVCLEFFKPSNRASWGSIHEDPPADEVARKDRFDSTRGNSPMSFSFSPSLLMDCGGFVTGRRDAVTTTEEPVTTDDGAATTDDVATTGVTFWASSEVGAGGTTDAVVVGGGGGGGGGGMDDTVDDDGGGGGGTMTFSRFS